MSASGAAPPHAKQHVCFVVAGHSQCGKSTIVGALLRLTNTIPDDTFDAVETAADAAGQTARRFAWISDKTKEEREVQHSITPKLWSLQFDQQNISLIDTPGHRSCALMSIASMCMADAALVAVSSKLGEFEQGIDSQGACHRATAPPTALLNPPPLPPPYPRWHTHAAARCLCVGNQERCRGGEPGRRPELLLRPSALPADRGENAAAVAQGAPVAPVAPLDIVTVNPGGVQPPSRGFRASGRFVRRLRRPALSSHLLVPSPSPSPPLSPPSPPSLHRSPHAARSPACDCRRYEGPSLLSAMQGVSALQRYATAPFPHYVFVTIGSGTAGSLCAPAS